ncbi:MAG: sugar phosphate isomerase/epimerase family protein [Acidimicrobiia bacterium]
MNLARSTRETAGARRVGIMQGRLSPRPPGRLQAFPWTSWRDEFSLAAELGFDGIEWVYEADRATDNPLVQAEGRRAIRQAIDHTGIRVLSVCGDYFMVHRLSDPGAAGEGAARELSRLIEIAHDIGARRILVPWLEVAALDTEEKRGTAIRNIKVALPSAEKNGVSLGIEMDIPGVAYRKVIEDIGHDLVVAYYDTGNSTAAGADVGNDVVALESRLGAVHVKDRVRGGATCTLGTGDTNFSGFFAQLSHWDFRGDVVLQHYFENPADDARRALSFVRRMWPRQEVA